MPRGKPKETDAKILDELKELNKTIKAMFVSLEDTRKLVDNMYNERRP